MFIMTEETPNPATLKFLPGREVLPQGQTLDLNNPQDAKVSPLAENLFSVAGINGVFLAHEFITVTKSSDKNWAELKPVVLARIMDHLVAKRPIINDGTPLTKPLSTPNESEVVKQIRELLDTRIRPAVAQDGGDIMFHSYEEGIVYLTLKGSCAGCPSSTATLKSGIENMLKHHIPEIQEVQQVL